MNPSEYSDMVEPIGMLVALLLGIWFYVQTRNKIKKAAEYKHLREQEQYNREIEAIFNELKREKTITSIECDDIELSENEECFYFREDVAWLEYRKIRKSVSYSNLKSSFGDSDASFTIGEIKPIVNYADELKPIEVGKLYITDKRVVLIGETSTQRVLLNKILLVDINFIKDYEMVVIKKDSGKCIYLMLGLHDAIYCYVAIKSLLKYS